MQYTCTCTYVRWTPTCGRVIHSLYSHYHISGQGTTLHWHTDRSGNIVVSFRDPIGCCIKSNRHHWEMENKRYEVILLTILPRSCTAVDRALNARPPSSLLYSLFDWTILHKDFTNVIAHCGVLFFSCNSYIYIYMYIYSESMHSNVELLGTLCEKRQDTALVIHSKHFITLAISAISRLLHSWAAFSLAYDSW